MGEVTACSIGSIVINTCAEEPQSKLLLLDFARLCFDPAGKTLLRYSNVHMGLKSTDMYSCTYESNEVQGRCPSYTNFELHSDYA